jgi:type IV secretory pathway TrbF-like protein
VNTLSEKRELQETGKPEKLRYSRYYEHDGALRAYANRAMILAFLCVPTTLLAVGFAVYVRLQPPTVIRVDPSGEATAMGRTKPEIAVVRGQESAPSEFEKRAFTWGNVLTRLQQLEAWPETRRTTGARRERS